jgi:hypothetical protein
VKIGIADIKAVSYKLPRGGCSLIWGIIIRLVDSCTNLRILAVILIDIIKAENKEAMVESLKQLLQAGNMTKWGLDRTISHTSDMKKMY